MQKISTGILLSILFLGSFCLITTESFSQDLTYNNETNRKGQLFIYWGWNRSAYTDSDIHFKGANYDFELSDVRANDRQSELSSDYINPSTITIPQFNFRVGYYLNEKYSLSFGLDHMKYVMVANQNVKINGDIADSGTDYDGSYENEDFIVAEDFLKFEHTDGLNYTNLELRRLDNILNWKSLELNLTTGLGAAVLLPKTNSTLLNNERYDDFNLAGYGFNALVGLNVTFWDYFFVQGELKGGFINMPNIRTTQFEVDEASQSFFFSQSNIVFGAFIPLAKGSKFPKD